jgi:hypothetical protein
MKTKHLLILFFLLIAGKTYSQAPKLQIAAHIPPDEAKRKSYSTLVWSSNEEFIISDRAKDGSVFSIYNGGTMKKTGTFRLDYPEVNNKDADWVRRLFHGDRITSIYGYYDKGEDEIKVYGRIDDRKNKTVKKPTILMESSAKKRKNIGELTTITSNDQSKILVFREPAGKKFEDEKMEMVLYDNELNKIWSKSLAFPYKNRSISVEEILVSNEGRVSIIAFWSPSKQEIRENPSLEDQMVFKIFGVAEDNDQLEEIQLKEKGLALSSCHGMIVDDSTNATVFTGFYRDEKSRKSKYSVNGVYYIKLNASTWNIDVIRFNVIDEKTLTEILMGANTSERAARKVKKAVDKGHGINNLRMMGIYIYKDASVKIISQIEYVVQSCTTDPKTNATRCTYYYHNNQIVEFNLSDGGELKSTFVVPKEQVMVNASFYNGHIPVMNNERTYYIYNDNDMNYNAKKVAKNDGNNFLYTFTARKKSRLCYVYFDNKGQAIKKPLMNHWKQNIFIYPGSFVRLNDGTVVTWGRIRKGKELMLVKLSVE